MPRELLLTAPRSLELVEYDEGPLGAREVRAEATTSGISLGTELALYRGSSLGGLTQIGCNDDNGETLQSRVQGSLTRPDKSMQRRFTALRAQPRPSLCSSSACSEASTLRLRALSV